MTETAKPRAPLTVTTDLEITVGTARVDVRSTGDRLFVDFPSLGALSRAKGGLSRRRIEGIAALLATSDLTVEIRARDRTVFAVGADAPAGPVSRWAGTAPAQVRVLGLLAAVGQELASGVRVIRDLLR
ncbi:MAG: hypothetical protein ACQEQY_07580 [Halobacteriota archaeon]